MDKLLKRVRMAERQVARRAKRTERGLELQELKNIRRTKIGLRRQAGRQLAVAIKNRHEDWELGSLAPRRDISQVDEDGNYWGSISADHASLQITLTKEQKEARAAWAGGHQYLCLAPGDRVAILDGPYKGKISKIKSIDREFLTVNLGDDILFNQTIPDMIRPDEMDRVEPYQAPIPVSSVRLVHPLPDPNTGAVRDVVIRELKAVGIIHDRPTKTVTWTRIIPGENIRVPWPKIAPKQQPEYKGDTKRTDVEERTFVPTLLTPPMPEAVLDELRGRYSIFRTRHTPEYIAKKEAEEAEKQARKKSAQDMLLPLQEYNRKLREVRRALGQPVLSEEMLEKIGAVIAKNAQLRASGRNAAVDNVQKAIEQLSVEDSSSSEPSRDQPHS